MIDLSSKKILTYDSTLSQLVLFGFNKDFIHSEDDFFYYKSDNPRLTDIKGTYIKLVPIAYYFETEQGKKWTAFKVENKTQIKASSVLMVRFKIVGIYYSIEKLKSKSKLKGFSRVIDDNNYFSQIPLINELVHWDNGVLVSSVHSIKTRFGDEWDKLKLNLTVSYNGETREKMTGGAGHVHL